VNAKRKVVKYDYCQFCKSKIGCWEDDRTYTEIPHKCKKPEAEKSCQTCVYEKYLSGYEQYEKKDCPCETCGDEYKNWKQKQEEIECFIEIEHRYYTNIGSRLNINLTDIQSYEQLKKLIPQGSTRKFKIIPIEGE
jgi:hypothetical protein